MSTLAIAPLQAELDIIVHTLKESGYDAILTQAAPLPVHLFEELDLIVAPGGVGKTQLAVHTLHLLKQFPATEAVFCIGAAGGLAPEIAVLDLVIAEKTLEHDYKERFQSKPRPRFPAHPALLAQLKSLDTGDLRMHFGTIASGNEDIVDEARAQELFRQTGALAVAWEGAGGARACRFLKKPYIELRAITDLATRTAASDFQAHLQPALTHATKVLLRFLKSN